MKRIFSAILAVSALMVLQTPAISADDLVFEMEMKDGAINPQRLEVPAKTRFKIIIKNTGSKPAEFESYELRKEEVVPAGGTGRLIIRSLDPGEYKFYDEFQPDAPPAVIVAK
jgi:hypothetical protein